MRHGKVECALAFTSHYGFKSRFALTATTCKIDLKFTRSFCSLPNSLLILYPLSKEVLFSFQFHFINNIICGPVANQKKQFHLIVTLCQTLASYLKLSVYYLPQNLET